MNVPESLRYWPVAGYLLTPYYTSPVMYKSLKDEEYIYKQDAYLILQNMTLEAYPFQKCQVFRMLFAMFLRTQELKNLGRMEFVKFDQNAFDEINEHIKESMKHFKTDPSEFYPLMSQLMNIEIRQLCENFKGLVPTNWREADVQVFGKAIVEYVQNVFNTPNFANQITILYSTTGEIIKMLKKIIDNRVEIFKSEESQIAVRLFEDGDERFVVEAELMDAISRSKKIPCLYLKDGMIIDTMSMEDVKKNYGELIQHFEFIRTPIIRAKHKAVHILVGEKYSVLAVDALFDLLKNAIFGLKLYQKYKKASSKDESDEFRFLESGFDPNRKSKIFITLEDAEHLLSMFKKKYEIYAHVPAKEVRNAKKDGFTVQNLKNELAWLNLTKAFPEIQSFADVVYSEVVKRKKEQFLRTCDLFDAIEQCELTCLFNRLPNFQKFLHNQKGCHRIYALTCERCEIEKRLKEKPEMRETESSESGQKTLDDPKIGDEKQGDPESENLKLETSEITSNKQTVPEDPTTATAPENENPPIQKTSEAVPDSGNTATTPDSFEQITPSVEVLMTAESKLSNNKKTPEPAPETKASPDSQKPSAPQMQTISSSKAVENSKSEISVETLAPESKESSESPNQKTSANCEKCFRACEMLDETKKELKSSENKLKNLEKKMLGKERGMEKFKEYQKGKLDEKEKENQMRTEEIQGLKKRIQERENENRSLKDQISKQESSRALVEEEKFRQEEQLEMTRKHLEERVSRLEQELREGNENMWELQNQMASDQAEFEAVILVKNREIEEWRKREIRMNAENDVNQRMIQQLMDKLASSGFRKNSEVSTSSTRIQKCEICWNETNDREAVRCQKCRRPFHQKCSSQWLKNYKTCPSCNEDFIESTKNHFSAFI